MILPVRWTRSPAFLPLALLLALVLPATSAHAYPWMIQHGYTNCSTCHVEPFNGIMYGAVPLPSWLNVGLSLRGAVLSTTTSQGTSWRDILMIADLRAGVTAGPFLASVSFGYVPTGANQAAITNQQRDNLVSREHWLGLRFDDNKFYVLGGRLNLPFGLRNVEHNSFVRAATRTDTNSSQQYGGELVWDAPGIRAAVMGIAGNLLLRDPDFREYGYSGYVEGAFSNSFTLGFSSLITHADLALSQFANLALGPDPFFGKSNSLRQAHGLFSRWHVGGPWVVLAEANLLVQSADNVATDWGGVGFLQADWEAIQGLHLIFTGEALRQRYVNSYGAWFSVSWFFFPYCEARIDVTFNEYGIPGGGHEPSLGVLGQLHFSM